MVDAKTPGFTLLEVVIALTILGLVFAMLFVSFRLALNSYQKSQERMEAQARDRGLLDEIKRQIGSLYPLRPTAAFLNSEMQAPDAGMTTPLLQAAQSPLFEGMTDSVTFITLSPLVMHSNPGLTVVRYGLAEDEWGRTYVGAMESRFSGIDSFDFMVRVPRGKPLPLIENVRQLVFEYYGYNPETQVFQWFNSWSGREAAAVPGAIRILYDDKVLIIPVNASFVISPTEERKYRGNERRLMQPR